MHTSSTQLLCLLQPSYLQAMQFLPQTLHASDLTIQWPGSTVSVSLITKEGSTVLLPCILSNLSSICNSGKRQLHCLLSSWIRYTRCGWWLCTPLMFLNKTSGYGGLVEYSYLNTVVAMQTEYKSITMWLQCNCTTVHLTDNTLAKCTLVTVNCKESFDVVRP